MSENTESQSVAEYSAEWWVKEIDQIDKNLDDKWRNSADQVVDRYLDLRSGDPLGRENDGLDARKYNIFWANVQILKSALYATPPKPDVRRQHGDMDDDIARTAALILQRMITVQMNEHDQREHAAIQQAVEDRLIPGLGQLWVRYEVETEEVPATNPLDGSPVLDENNKPVMAQRIVDEDAPIEYVHWRDFYWSAARTWEEVWWVGRRIWMKRKSFIKRFGQTKYDALKRDIENSQRDKGYPKGFEKGRIEVFELWCEDTMKVYWVHRLTKTMLDEKDDFLQIEGFWPCPKPLLATHTTNSVIPRPDYVMVQDQYTELDNLNNRISMLIKALRVVGVYDKNNNELKNLLTGGEFQMIAVDNWAMLGEKGGLKGAVDWFPVEQVSKVLKELVEQRPFVIQQIYELTSISDIMRGVTSPRETAKAQTLKAQYSSVRLQLSQKEVSRFVIEALRIKAKIIAKLFSPESIAKISQIENSSSREFAQVAIQLIKDTEAREYRINIGEETMSLADYNAEREMRIELITAVGQFVSQAGQILQIIPQALPYMLEMLKWVAASFRGSADIETVLDKAVAQLTQNPPQLPNEQGEEPKADPLEVERIKDQRERDFHREEMDFKRQESAAAREDEQMKAERDQKINEMQDAFKHLMQTTQEELQLRGQETTGVVDAIKIIGQSIEAMTKIQLEIAQVNSDSQQEATEALINLAKVIAKPRRRVPHKDPETGEILYTQDEDVPEAL